MSLETLLKPNPDALVEVVASGDRLAIGKNQTGVPCEMVRAMVRKQVRDLHVIGVPTGGYAIDLLVGAQCVRTVESSAVTLDESGSAPRFVDAVKSSAIQIIDSTCPAVYAGLSAGEKGIPFIPIRGLIGSDVAGYRDDYRIINNPYEADDPILVVPAIRPDFALIHAPMADDQGNIYVGGDKDALLMAHAAVRTLVTVERLFEGSLLDRPRLRSSTLSSVYVAGIATAPRGAWPMPLVDEYDEDLEHVAEYRRLALTADGFDTYIERFVTAQPEQPQ